VILLAVTTDGRKDCLEQAIPSLSKRVEGIDGPRLIFDDSGDAEYRQWLRETYEPQGFWIGYGEERVGQGEALARAWTYLRSRIFADHPYVFFCEDDFLFERDVDLDAMRSTLEDRPYLAQMALLRQPWFKGEVRAGGIIERDPDEYELVSDGEHEWHEHRLWWTLNPCLFRRELCHLKRPAGSKHEWHFSRQLCQDPEVRFGLWGDGAPWVRHIGEERVGVGY
jgi:hypothetical protein